MLISERYRELNKTLHDERSDYGGGSRRWASMVWTFIERGKHRSALDYGAGKGRLHEALRTLLESRDIAWQDYDPAIPQFSATPDPAHFVVCTDVLEHIEPEFIDEVLTDLRRVTQRRLFLVVSTREAQKKLPDGRNAHLIQKPPEWWLREKLLPIFEIDWFDRDKDDEFRCLLR